jgi:hypothetical protein
MPSTTCCTPAADTSTPASRRYPDHHKRTLCSDDKEGVECGDHRLAALEPVPLQVRELDLQKLIKRLALHQQPVHARLLRRIGRRGGLRLEDVGEPETLGLGRRVHVLVRDAADVHGAQVRGDVAQGPRLWGGVGRADRLRPDDAVDVELLRGVREAVARGAERGDLLALQQVERVDARGAVAVGAQRVDVAQQGRVGGAVCELRWGVWGGVSVWAHMWEAGGVQSGRAKSRGLRKPKDSSWYLRRGTRRMRTRAWRGWERRTVADMVGVGNKSRAGHANRASSGSWWPTHVTCPFKYYAVLCTADPPPHWCDLPYCFH